MRTATYDGETEGFPSFDGSETRVLGTDEERLLLRELAESKRKLAAALAQLPGSDTPRGADAPEALTQYLASARAGNGPAEARLGAVYHRYCELRSKLALANLRLVAHVAKRFRNRGIAYADLIQEGFCGLLEAIDRFDLAHETKLATYATWWIRQAMQCALAAGAYPVRLSPRHLRQLAQSQDERDGATAAAPHDPAEGAGNTASPEMLRRILAATRPTISLDASLDPESHFRLSQAMSAPEADRTGGVDSREAVAKLMQALRPREQQVLSLRFGLGGQSRLSLSEVGKVLAVSKERVRQIQDRALEKLRSLASEEELAEVLAGVA
ncbi:MAG TPA: sigma-70 family RNA polymerase sigma factor [Isosphaeraceae bacterium]|jgi:RNA polymerase primary sigma factor